MKKLLLVFAIFLMINTVLLSSIILTSDNVNVISQNDKLTLKVEVVQGFSGTQNAVLRVRPFESLSYSSYEMQRGNDSNPVYSYTFNNLKQFGKGFDYYFEVIAIDGTKVTLPEYQPSINPFRIDIEEKLDYEAGLIKLSPDSKYISKDNFVIAVSFYSLKNKIDKKSIKLVLNGEDITAKAKIFSDMIVAKIKNPNKGIHRFYIKAKLKNGKEIKSKVWESTVETKQFNLPFELNSSIKLNHSGYATKYDSLSKNRSQTNFRMRTTMEKDWFGFKSNIYLSSYQRDYRQNINRLMFDFYVPSFDLILGDYSPNMGDLVMNGKNVRGITGDFHFKNFKLKITSGALKKAINGDKKIDEQGNEYYTAGTFKMKNLSAMMQVGSDNGFSWGISFAKNKDDINSLKEKYYAVLDTVIIDSLGNPDSLYTYMVTPQDNFVIGSNLKLTLFQRRIDMGLDVAMSVYNPNIIGGALTEDEITEQYANVHLPLDPKDFESIYVYNLNSQPLKPGKANMAYKLHFRTLFFKNYFNISYSSIGAVYKTLSVTSLEQDTQTISIYDNFNYIKYFNLNFGVKITRDNVDNSRDVTNHIVNYSVGAFYHSPEYPSLGFMIQSTTAEDKETYKTGTNYFMMSTGYQFGNIPKVPSKISFSFSNFDNSDLKFDTFSNNKKVIGLKSITYFEDLPLVTTMKFDYGIEKNDTKTNKDDEEKNSYTVFSIQNQLKFLDERLKPYFSFSNKSFGGDAGSKHITILRLGTSYNFYENTNLYTDFGYVTYGDKDNPEFESNSIDWNLTLSYKF